jgi:hypothetical protein
VLEAGLDLPSSDSLTLPDKHLPMLILLDLMRESIEAHPQPMGIFDQTLVPIIIGLADKYNVGRIVHFVYSSAIVRAIDHQVKYGFSALLYAIKSKDEWLCKNITSRLQIEDPADCSKRSTDLLGYDAWWALVNAFPRKSVDPMNEKWRNTADKVDWVKHF